MSKRAIRMSGERIHGSRVSAELLRDLLDLLLEGSQKVVRLQVEGRSTARGAKPAWLDPAADFEIVGIEEGSTRVVIEGPSLHEAIPDKFSQQALFGEIDDTKSALDYLTESLRDAAEGQKDSELFDGSLIATFSKLDRLMKRGIDVIEFEDARPLRIGAESVALIGQMRRELPPSRHVRVSGKLETIIHSNRRFVLLQEDGKIHGVAEDNVSAQELAHLFGKQVVVSGAAHFRPSGGLLRIEAETVREAGSNASVWATRPTPLLQSELNTDLHRAQGPRSGLSAIIGKWPDDDDDDEIFEALCDIS